MDHWKPPRPHFGNCCSHTGDPRRPGESLRGPNFMNRFLRTMRSFARGPVLALALCTGAVALAGAATAFAAPTIDGNLSDFIAYGDQLRNSGTGFGLAITDKPNGQGNPTPENPVSYTHLTLPTSDLV